jgi:hypothetical protein
MPRPEGFDSDAAAMLFYNGTAACKAQTRTGYVAAVKPFKRFEDRLLNTLSIIRNHEWPPTRDLLASNCDNWPLVRQPVTDRVFNNILKKLLQLDPAASYDGQRTAIQLRLCLRDS